MTINPISSAEYRYDSVNNRVYVVNGNLLWQNIGSVSVIDAATLEVIDTITSWC